MKSITNPLIYFYKRIVNKFSSNIALGKNDISNTVNKNFLDGPKIHFGSGDITIDGWINIDTRPLANVDIIGGEEAFDKFEDNALAAVYACHVLEHISHLETSKFLDRIYKKISVGGKIIISVPDFKNIVKAYESYPGGIASIQSILYGGQDYKENLHMSCYDEKYLSKLLTQVGFKNICKWNTQELFGIPINDWSDKNHINVGENLPISLNLIGIK